MIKNYLRIAARTILKTKLFAAINILSLAIGISASLVIFLLVDYHFSFEKFEKDSDRIYRVVSDFSFSGEVFRNSGVTTPLGPTTRKELTGLTAVVPFRTLDEVKVTVRPDPAKEPIVFKKQKNTVYADSAYFKLLGYQWLSGSPASSLSQPFQAVLSASNRKLYFPNLTDQEVIGKVIILDDTISHLITGVVKDIPYNTDFSFKLFISSATLETTRMKPQGADEWNSTNSASQLLLKLDPGVSPQKIEKGVYALYDKYRKKEQDDHSSTAFHLQPLKDIHFNANYGGYSKPLAHRPTLYSLIAVAAFLLLLGCINFINLTTAQAARRAREIGIRKTMGSSRRQIIFQFLSETAILTFLATVLSTLLTPLILKAFSGFIPDDLHFNLFDHPGIIFFLLILLLIVTLLSGFYPALILSGYKPVLVLKNQAYANTSGTRSSWLRKTLTISQFAIAQVFIMGAIMVSKQIHFSINKDQGFKKDAIVLLNTNYYDTAKSKKYVLIEKLRAIQQIDRISVCNNPPSSGNSWSSTLKYKDGKKEIETNVQQKFGDSNYIKLYGIRLLAGTNLEQTDTVKAFLVNETYAHILGFQQPQQAVGKYLEYNNKQVPIQGVVADFNQSSLHEPIKPLVIGSWGLVEDNISIALRQPVSEWKGAIAKMETAWKEIYPKDDFNYQFFDEDIAKYYDAEKHISSLLMWATGLAVFISCLGLLGLVIYTTTQRTKEIGVRKVLGASVSQVVALLSKDFILLVAIAFLIAAPFAWWGVHVWLQGFAYRTGISWWIFVLAGCLMVVVALITLCFQTIRAAIANPVHSLRSE